MHAQEEITSYLEMISEKLLLWNDNMRLWWWKCLVLEDPIYDNGTCAFFLGVTSVHFQDSQAISVEIRLSDKWFPRKKTEQEYIGRKSRAQLFFIRHQLLTQWPWSLDVVPCYVGDTQKMTPCVNLPCHFWSRYFLHSFPYSLGGLFQYLLLKAKNCLIFNQMGHIPKLSFTIHPSLLEFLFVVVSLVFCREHLWLH